jgi:hypothetical protein
VRRPHPEKPGTMAEHAFQAQFAWLDDDAHQAWLDDVSTRQLRDRDAMAPLLLAVREVFNPDGSPIAATPEALAAFLRAQGVGSAVAAAYFKSRAEAAQKN